MLSSNSLVLLLFCFEQVQSTPVRHHVTRDIFSPIESFASSLFNIGPAPTPTTAAVVAATSPIGTIASAPSTAIQESSSQTIATTSLAFSVETPSIASSTSSLSQISTSTAASTITSTIPIPSPTVPSSSTSLTTSPPTTSSSAVPLSPIQRPSSDEPTTTTSSKPKDPNKVTPAGISVAVILAFGVLATLAFHTYKNYPEYRRRFTARRTEKNRPPLPRKDTRYLNEDSGQNDDELKGRGSRSLGHFSFAFHREDHTNLTSPFIRDHRGSIGSFWRNSTRTDAVTSDPENHIDLSPDPRLRADIDPRSSSTPTYQPYRPIGIAISTPQATNITTTTAPLATHSQQQQQLNHYPGLPPVQQQNPAFKIPRKVLPAYARAREVTGEVQEI